MTHIFNHRVNQPDHRDTATAFTANAVVPPVYDLWEHYTEIPRWDQGQEGSCGGHALARACQHEEQKQGVTFTGDRVSPAYAYYVAREVMGTTSQDSGVDNRSLFKGLDKYGWVHETDMPYVAGDFATAPSAAAENVAATHIGSTYGLVTPAHMAVRQAVSGGKAVVIGFSVPDYFEEPAIYDPSKDYLPLPTDVRQFKDFVGGHDVAITAYDYSLTRWKIPVFIIDNSWDENWGLCFNAPSKKAGRFAMDANWLSVALGGQKLTYDLTILDVER